MEVFEMTAKKCDKCGKFFDAQDSVVVVLNATFGEAEQANLVAMEPHALYHVACFEEITAAGLEACDEEQEDPEKIRRLRAIIRKERAGIGKYGEKGTPIKNPVICHSCEKPTRVPVLTCPRCYRRISWET
jgi:hypothetical protein